MESFEMFARKQVMPDEKILWKGSPVISKIFSKQDIYLIPLSIVWSLMFLLPLSSLIIVAKTGEIANDFLRIFLIFLLISFIVQNFYVFIGRFIAKRFTKRNLIYIITDMRIIIVKQNWKLSSRHSTSLDIKTISAESFTYDRNGIGTIIFGEASWVQEIFLNSGLEFLGFTPQVTAFFDIRECEHVFKIYKEAKYQRENPTDLL